MEVLHQKIKGEQGRIEENETGSSTQSIQQTLQLQCHIILRMTLGCSWMDFAIKRTGKTDYWIRMSKHHYISILQKLGTRIMINSFFQEQFEKFWSNVPAQGFKICKNFPGNKLSYPFLPSGSEVHLKVKIQETVIGNHYMLHITVFMD
jgi:hypothetical protein